MIKSTSAPIPKNPAVNMPDKAGTDLSDIKPVYTDVSEKKHKSKAARRLFGDTGLLYIKASHSIPHYFFISALYVFKVDKTIKQ